MAFAQNDRLVAARAAALLTQATLAELANAQVERDTGKRGAMDADYISKLERGVHTWPSKPYRQALRTVLGAARDHDLGFYSARSRRANVDTGQTSAVARGSDDVRRQAFLRALAAAVAGLAVGDPLAEGLGQAAKGATPTRVGATEVQQVDHAIAMFGDWQDLYGGGACKDAIAGQVQWATGLLQARATDAVRNDLYRSVGFLADVAGWGAFDAGQHDTARQYFELALSCAEQADDWGLRANVLSDMARQAIYVGRPDDGLSLIELAQVRQDRQTPTVRAMLETVRARSLAKVGRTEDSYGAVLAAEEHFGHQNPADDPPWITYFDAPELASDTGHALLDGALDGRHTDDARSRLQQAIESYPRSQARARAFATAKLATLELRVGDAQRGITLAEQALNTASQLTSQRAHDDLVDVRSALILRHDVPGSIELRTRLTRTIGTT